jgi:hypothetical protein
MTKSADSSLVVAIEVKFFDVDLPHDNPSWGDAVLRHIPLGDEPPQADRRIPVTQLRMMIAMGDAVPVDGRLLKAAARSLAKRNARRAATGRRPRPEEKAAVERIAWMLLTGTLHSAAALRKAEHAQLH